MVYIYKKDPEFTEKLKNQPYFCLEHAAMLLDAGIRELSEARYLEFSQILLSKTRSELESLRKNVTAFCRSFDHENAGKPLTDETRYAVESAVAFLSGDFEK